MRLICWVSNPIVRPFFGIPFLKSKLEESTLKQRPDKSGRHRYCEKKWIFLTFCVSWCLTRTLQTWFFSFLYPWIAREETTFSHGWTQGRIQLGKSAGQA